LIGIICNYYIRNYGSVLQSLALQHKLNTLEIDNEVIKYEECVSKNKKIEIFVKIQLPKLLKLNTIKEKVEEKFYKNKDVFYRKIMKERQESFQSFVDAKISFSEKYDDIEEIKNNLYRYQGIVLGSDQLWCPSDLIIDYHTLAWIPEKVYTATYATSFGVSYLNNSQRKIVKKFLPQISKISVREKSAVDLIKSINDIEVEQVVDPTLLLDKSEWDELLKWNKVVEGKYIFCYFLSNNTQLKKWANELRKKTGLKIVSIPHLESYDIHAKEFGDILLWKVNPEELINLIRNAEYVLSDSFHVSIFSIIYEKKFLVFDRYSRNSKSSRNTRIDNLLSITSLSPCLFQGERDIQVAANQERDFQRAIININQQREYSVRYLRQVLYEVKKHEDMESENRV